MSAEDNKALVRRVLAEVRDGWTQAVIDQFFTPDYRRHLTPTGPHLTREEQRERASRLRVAFPDAEVTLDDMLAERDRVAYRLTIRGTHQGSFLRVAATGRRVTRTAGLPRSGAASTRWICSGNSGSRASRLAETRPRPAPRDVA